MKTAIANCNIVIAYMDALEELRPFYNPKYNLRRIVTSRNIYWKNKYTENRIKVGDECTKIFHSMATITLRKMPSCNEEMTEHMDTRYTR